MLKQLLAISCVTFALGGCGKADKTAESSPEQVAPVNVAETPTTATTPEPAPTPTPTVEGDGDTDGDVEIPTEVDFESEALAEVTSENLEKELAALEAEVGE